MKITKNQSLLIFPGDTMIPGKYVPVGNLRFSNSFWQPIVDLDYSTWLNRKLVNVQGPMLALVMEFCKKELLKYLDNFLPRNYVTCFSK